jgi:hypothetical protein
MSRNPLLPILFGLQCLIMGVVTFGDIGFDRPGRFGLDFDHFVLLAAGYLGLLGAGLIYAGLWKQWRWIAIQVATPLLIYACIYYIATHKVHYDAADNQHIVGLSRAEVHERLGKRNRTIAGGAGSSLVGSSQIDYEFESYRGMMVYYSPGGPVIAVERPGEMKFLEK